MMMTIWERYFLREIVKVTLLFIFCFYLLYFLGDYTSRTSNLISGEFPFQSLLYYYLLIFLKHIDILLPFALLLATIKTLCGLNINNELVAMLAGGIKLQQLLRPFIFVGIAATALMYLNFEVLVPATLYKAKIIEDAHFKGNKLRRNGVQEIALYDGSVVLYQAFDTVRECFFDAYWIRSLDDIYRIKYLFPNPDFTVGRLVDHLVRIDTGDLEHVEAFDTRVFPEMSFDDELLLTALRTSDELSLSQLWRRLPSNGNSPSEKSAQALAWFCLRLAMPWLCLLAVIAPAPFCLRFTRQLRVLFIYILGILGLIVLYFILDAALVAAEAQILNPVVTILAPVLVAFVFFGWRFRQLQ